MNEGEVGYSGQSDNDPVAKPVSELILFGIAAEILERLDGERRPVVMTSPSGQSTSGP